MKDKFLTSFKNLKPNQKGIVIMLGAGLALTLLGLVAYFSSSGTPKVQEAQAKETKSQVLAMDGKLLEKNQVLEAQKDAQVAKDALDDMKKQEEERKKQEAAVAAGLVPPPPGTPQAASPMKAGQMPPAQRASVNLPPPPPIPRAAEASAGSAKMPPPAMPPQPEVSSEIGGISIVESSRKEASVAGDEGKKKDENRSVYLPISYMEATLLSGLDAPTSADAKGNPVPALIRVKTPAVLPNDVKANLQGCFVVADGKGNLGTERAEMVLVALSCIDRKGQAVIDQPLTGYVVDGDGKAGLRGRVVTKMGAMITRSMFAGIFGGFGDALKNSSTTTNFSALGSVSQIKPEDIGMAGLGQGLSNAFKEIQKFYLELAHQTLPVIEVGAARPITLVITKGTNIDIKRIRGNK